MNLNQFNFAHPYWLFALGLAPTLWLISRFWNQPLKKRNLEAFADPELLPYLVKGYTKSERVAAFLPLWAGVWTLGVLALAGPRWSFTEIPAYHPQKALVVALDLSHSMDARDVKPTRLERAKEKIADLLVENPDLKIGLIAFAGDAHMITPVTEDRSTIRHLLPALETDLVEKPGRNFNAAGDLAASMLKGDSLAKAFLLISDSPRRLSLKGVHTSVLDASNPYARVPSETELFGVESFRTGAEFSGVAGKDWAPGFYVFLIPAMLLLLFFFRKQRVLAQAGVAVVALLFVLPSARADTVKDLFVNQASQGKAALEAQDYHRAEEKLSDPYRRGVAQYRAGNFAAASASFAQSKRPQVATDARYNLGNSLAREGKFEEAVVAYKQALKERPGFSNAQTNLKIVEDLLKKKPPEQQSQKQNQKQQAKNQQQNGGQGQQAKNQNGGEAKSQAKPEDKSKQAKPGGEDRGQAQKQAQQKSAKPGQDVQKPEQVAAEPKTPGQAPLYAKQGQGNLEQKAGAAPAGHRPSHDDQKEAKKYARDVDADQWLNLVRNDPHQFLKNQFMIESARAESGQRE